MKTARKSPKAASEKAKTVRKTTAKKVTPAKVKSPASAAKKSSTSMTFEEVMRTLEAAGSETTRKTYARHGAKGPMFGVNFGTLSKLQKRIRVDHDLALRLWATTNVDARNLAMKIADPAVIKPGDLDQWARENPMPMCNLYVASLASESPLATKKMDDWLASSDAKISAAGWTLVGVQANRDEAAPDQTFTKLLDRIEKSIHSAANEVKSAMNGALIAIGGRSAGLRKAACAAAKRIGKLEVDHGDTACQTPDAIPYIDKLWERSEGRFPSPAAAERSRDSMRTRC